MSAAARKLVNDILEPHGFMFEDLVSRSRHPHLDRLRGRCYLELEQKREWSHQQIGFLVNRDRRTISNVIRKQRSQPMRQKTGDTVEELRAQIRRLSGVELAPRLTKELDLKLWQSIFLAILAETYPRVLTPDALLELYEEGAVRIGYREHGDDVDLSREMMRQFIYRVRRHFQDRGLPNPLTSVRPGMVVLSDEIAPWMQAQFGRPFSVKTEVGYR